MKTKLTQDTIISGNQTAQPPKSLTDDELARKICTLFNIPPLHTGWRDEARNKWHDDPVYPALTTDWLLDVAAKNGLNVRLDVESERSIACVVRVDEDGLRTGPCAEEVTTRQHSPATALALALLRFKGVEV